MPNPFLDGLVPMIPYLLRFEGLPTQLHYGRDAAVCHNAGQIGKLVSRRTRASPLHACSCFVLTDLYDPLALAASILDLVPAGIAHPRSPRQVSATLAPGRLQFPP
jgi:hypothetical protein